MIHYNARYTGLFPPMRETDDLDMVTGVCINIITPLS